MTTTPSQRRLDRAARINAVGLIALLVGVAAVVIPAFATDPKLGCASLGVLLIAVAWWAVTYDDSRQV